MSLRRFFLICLAVLLVNLLRSTKPTPIVFLQNPDSQAVWTISSPNIYLGNVVHTTLTITSQPGVQLNLEHLPSIGDTVKLPYKTVYSQTINYPPYDIKIVPEGNVEVVDKRIHLNYQNSSIVTIIEYDFQYLLPLDLSEPVDNKKLPDFYLTQTFLVQIDDHVTLRTTSIHTTPDEFYIIPRVDEQSKPIFKYFRLTPTISYTTKLNYYLGIVLVASAILLLFWQLIRFLKSSRRSSDPSQPAPDLKQLYATWTQSHNEDVFIETLILYRDSVWGTPKPSTWFEATIVLYSGRKLNQERINNLFNKILQEVE